jgi:hypothetical protein
MADHLTLFQPRGQIMPTTLLPTLPPPPICGRSGVSVVVLVTELVRLSDINNHPFIVPPSDAVFSFRSFSREHDLATVKVGGKEAGLASCWLAICPRRGWISFFVIAAESSELILCSMLETETTESMIIGWRRVVIEGHMMEQVLLLDLPEYGVRGNMSPPPRSAGSASYVYYNVNWTVHRTI